MSKLCWRDCPATPECSTWRNELSSFQANVPECLKTKSVFLKWEEEPPSVNEVIIQVDENGCFLSYTSDLEKEITSIDLSQINDIRFCLPKEKIRETLESFSKEPLAERSFAIIYGSNLVDVNFLRISSWSVHIAKEWVKAMNSLIANRKFPNPSVSLLLTKQYIKVCSMKNSLGKIPIKNICKCLNASRFEQRFYDGMQTLQLPHLKNDEIDPDEFTLEHFYKLYTFLCPRQDLDQIFTKMCGGRAPFLKLKQFVDFLNNEQRDPRLNEILFPYYCTDKASKLVNKFEPSPELSQTNRMGYDGFTRFLMSKENLILKEFYLSEKHDLSHPLSHYFIHSSHNTYLIGRQFGGKSSVEMYRQCLLAGCRCIELDCWDGLNDEPIITHGRALCSNILFKDVIAAIKETAFATSPLPVILSFENHCSLLQQRKLAEYCIDIFGEMLLDKHLDGWPLEENVSLPPPNQLMYKIIIKNKKLLPEVEKDLLITEIANSNHSLEKLDIGREEPTISNNNEEDQSITNRNSNLPVKGTAPQKRLSVISEGNHVIESSKEGGFVVREERNDQEETLDEEEATDREEIAEGKDTIDADDPTDREDTNRHEDIIGREDTEGAVTMDKESLAGNSLVNKGSIVSPPDIFKENDFRVSNDTDKNGCKGETFPEIRANDSVEDFGEVMLPSSKVDGDFDEMDWNKIDILQEKRLHVSNGNSRSLIDVFIQRSDPCIPGSLGSLSDVSDISDFENGLASPNDRSRSESARSTQSIEEACLIVNDCTESPESQGQKNSLRTSRIGGSTKKILEGARRMKSSPVISSRSLSCRSTKSGSNRNSTGDLHELKSHRLTTDDCNDSDDELKRKSRSSSTASSTTLSSGITRYSKKSSRGTSFNNEEDDSYSLQFSSQKNVIDPLLSSLVNYVQPVVFQSFESSEEKNMSFKISSFNECSGIQLVKTGPVEFTKYNNRQFSRIYPKGTRVDSTNYNPQAFWNVGCQLVTLNLQTADVPYQLNHAKFEANSQLGYLLKPEIMRRPEKAFDPFTESPIDGIIPATLSVKVISGQFLTDKKCQTYVMVDLYGLPADTKRKNKTKLAPSNFMNTLFGDESFVYNKIILPELALLRLAVYDEGDRFLGQRVLPLDGIQPGYRHIPLRTESGQQLPLSTLFVHITLKTYVPEKFADFADRLFDPMKYQTEVDKRQEQMQVFDISEMEEDIDAIRDSVPGPITSRQSVTSLFSINSAMGSPLLHLPENRKCFSKSGSGTNLLLLSEVAAEEKPDEPVSFEDLKRDKQFVKMVKKHQKDVDMLERKHDKERVQLQKSNQANIEKIKSSFEKYKLAEERLYEKASKRPGSCRPDGNDDLLAKYNQKKQYLEERMNEKLQSNASKNSKDERELTISQVHERVGLRLYQIAEQLEHLKSLLSQSQRNEEKILKEKLDREMAELKKRQAKQSIEEAKSLSADRSIKSKEEKERLQREKDKQNMSRFLIDRQMLAHCHDKELEALEIKHKEEIERMEKEHTQIMEIEKGIFRKVTLAKQTDSIKLSKVSQRF